MKKTLALTLTAFLCGASAAFAEITYIDANIGNTKEEQQNGDLITFTTAPAVTGTEWGIRTYGDTNGGSVWSAGAQVEETLPERLLTTFTLTETGKYEIYGFYWVSQDGESSWDAQFALGDGTPVNFTGTGTDLDSNPGVNIAGSTDIFNSSVKTTTGGTNSIDLFSASLGTWDTSVDGTTVSVYAGAPFITTTGNDGRTWYDGVGYEAVPEPSSYAALLGVVALLAAHSRRRYMPRASK